jgi:hypothetical protein
LIGSGNGTVAGALFSSLIRTWFLLVTQTSSRSRSGEYSLQAGKIIVASDCPIPALGSERFLHDCEKLLERSPLKAERYDYRLYITNARWRQRLFFLLHPDAWGIAYPPYLGGNAFLTGTDFNTGRVVHGGYITPPRTLAHCC